MKTMTANELIMVPGEGWLKWGVTAKYAFCIYIDEKNSKKRAYN